MEHSDSGERCWEVETRWSVRELLGRVLFSIISFLLSSISLITSFNTYHVFRGSDLWGLKCHLVQLITSYFYLLQNQILKYFWLINHPQLISTSSMFSLKDICQKTFPMWFLELNQSILPLQWHWLAISLAIALFFFSFFFCKLWSQSSRDVRWVADYLNWTYIWKWAIWNIFVWQQIYYQIPSWLLMIISFVKGPSFRGLTPIS